MGVLDEALDQSQAMNKMLLDTGHIQHNHLKFLRRMIVLVVVCFTIIMCTMIVGFFWYESQFTTTITTTETKEVDVKSEGDGAKAQYNEITTGADSEVDVHD